MKKILIWVILAILFSVVSVSAAVTDEDLRNGGESYFPMDEGTGTTIEDLVNGDDGSLNGPTWNTNGIIENSLTFDTNQDDYVDISNSPDLGNSYTVHIWFKTPYDEAGYLINFDDGVISLEDNDGDSGNGNLFWRYGGYIGWDIPSSDYSDDTWHLLSFVVSSASDTQANAYLDGQQLNTVTDNLGGTANGIPLEIGVNNAGLSFRGDIDEVYLKSGQDNASIIQEYYDRQSQDLAGSHYPFESAVLSFQNITVNNEEIINDTVYNNSLLNFSVDVLNTSTNGDVNQTYNLFYNNGTQINSSQYATNNLNGSFSINLSNGGYKINLFAENNETSVQSQNYSIRIDINPPELNVSIPSEINTYDLNLTEEINFSATGLASIDTCQVTFNYSFNSSQQITPCENETFSFDYNGNWTYDIFVNDTAGNFNTDNGSIFVNPFVVFDFEDDNGSDIDDFQVNGETFTEEYKKPIFDIISVSDRPSNQTFTFERNGFETSNFTRELNATSDLNETITVPFAKIIVKVFDRKDRNLINDRNVTLQLIGPEGDNATVTTGKFNFTNENFTAERYHILADASGYNSEQFYFDYNAQEQVNVDIYMLNSTSPNAGKITIIAKDQFSQFIQGAICRAKEWRGDTSSYETVGQGLTNSNGEVLLNIELGVKEYVFECSKDGLSSSLEPEVIQTDLDSRTIILREGEDKLQELFTGLTYEVTETISGNVSTINFTYTDKSAQVTQACITFYDLSGSSKSKLAETCSSSTAATITESFQINNTFAVSAEASFTFNNNIQRTVERFTYNSVISITNFLDKFNLGIWVPLILALAGISLGLIANNLYIIFIGIGVSAWVSFIIIPSIITGQVAVAITTILGLASWASFRRGR